MQGMSLCSPRFLATARIRARTARPGSQLPAACDQAAGRRGRASRTARTPAGGDASRDSPGFPGAGSAIGAEVLGELSRCPPCEARVAPARRRAPGPGRLNGVGVLCPDLSTGEDLRICAPRARTWGPGAPARPLTPRFRDPSEVASTGPAPWWRTRGRTVGQASRPAEARQIRAAPEGKGRRETDLRSRRGDLSQWPERPGRLPLVPHGPCACREQFHFA